MKHILYTILCATILFPSCLDDCPECFTPPEPFLFELVDQSTGENLITNGTFLYENITFKKSGSDQLLEHRLIDERNENLILFNAVGWQTEQVTVQLLHDEELLFQFDVNAEVISNNCCTFTRFHEVDFGLTNISVDVPTGVHKIEIPISNE